MAIDVSIRLSPKGSYLASKLVLKAWCNYLLGHLSEAEKIARCAPNRSESGPFRWLGLAAIYARQGRAEDAAAAVKKTLEIRKDMSLGVFRKYWGSICPEYLAIVMRDLEKAGFPH